MPSSGRKLSSKTDEKVRPSTTAKDGRWDNFFAKKVAALVPFRPEAEPEPEGRAVRLTSISRPERTKTQHDPMQNELTRSVAFGPPTVTTPSQLGKQSRQTNATPFSTTPIVPRAKDERRAKAAQEKKNPAPKLAGFALLLLASALVGWALMQSFNTDETSPITKGIGANDPKFRENVELYKKMTGWRMNRDRVNVEIENLKGAPPIEPGARKMPGPDMMSGLPLMGEENAYKGSRDRTLPENSTYPDARIQYGLQEEQDMKEWDARAKMAYQKDFINNAASAGVRIQVDTAGRVKVDPNPIPIEQRPVFNEDTGEWSHPGGVN